jgi:DNA polymerase-3 subunit gamma/tau
MTPVAQPQASQPGDVLPVAPVVLDDVFVAKWPQFAAQLPITGMAQQLATQSHCVGVSGDTLSLRVTTQALMQDVHVRRLSELMSQQLGLTVKLAVSLVDDIAEGLSAQSIADAQARQRQQQAEALVRDDPFVNALIQQCDGHVVPGSVRAIESPDRSVST